MVKNPICLISDYGLNYVNWGKQDRAAVIETKKNEGKDRKSKRKGKG